MEPIKVDAEFSDVKANFTTTGTNKVDWTDDRLLGLIGFELPELGQSDMLAMSKHVLGRLETGISERDVAKLMVVAWSAVMPGKVYTRVFPKTTPCTSMKSLKIESADDEIIESTKAVSQINYPTDEVMTCQAAGYICLTLLRLASKDPAGYITNTAKIQKRFNDFYSKSFPLAPFLAKPQSITNIAALMQNRLVYKNTLSAFLYHAKENKEAQGLIESTYAMHLRDTGLRCWSLFKENSQLLNADAGVLLTILKIESTLKAVRCIATIIRNFECEDTELVKSKRERKTYCYARIYDNEAFLDLQTKNCLPLALTLASLNRKLNPRGTGDVMSMVAIRNTDEEVKKMYNTFAQIIYEYFNKSEASALGNVLFKKALERDNPPPPVQIIQVAPQATPQPAQQQTQQPTAAPPAP